MKTTGNWKESYFYISNDRLGQTMDGFGVNINAKYWMHGRLQPVVDLLTDDLNAALFRVDIYGKSDWIDPTGTLGKERALSAENLERVYAEDVFTDGCGLLRYLNSKGLKPYVTCSGDVPEWMLGADKKTLADYDAFCDMLVSYIAWLKEHEKIDFTFFGPLNETDLGSPEGPTVLPDAYVEVCALLDQKLHEKGYDDIKLIVAEQALFDSKFIRVFAKNPSLADRVQLFSLHCYGDLTNERYAEVIGATTGTAYEQKHFWLSEYGDLDQTGEKEWYIAQKSTERVFHAIENGFAGAMQWDAFDNYHDHDAAWTIYGLIRYARNVATPKKRYYAAKQLYRFVRPGYERLRTESSDDALRILAFAGEKQGQMTVVGMNTSDRTHFIRMKVDPAISDGKPLHFYCTTEDDNCVRAGDVDFANKIDIGLIDTCEVFVPPYAIFTLTNLD